MKQRLDKKYSEECEHLRQSPCTCGGIIIEECFLRPCADAGCNENRHRACGSQARLICDDCGTVFAVSHYEYKEVSVSDMRAEKAALEEKILSASYEAVTAFNYKGWSACQKRDRGKAYWQLYTCLNGKRRVITMGRDWDEKKAKERIDKIAQ